MQILWQSTNFHLLYWGGEHILSLRLLRIVARHRFLSWIRCIGGVGNNNLVGVGVYCLVDRSRASSARKSCVIRRSGMRPSASSWSMIFWTWSRMLYNFQATNSFLFENGPQVNSSYIECSQIATVDLRRLAGLLSMVRSDSNSLPPFAQLEVSESWCTTNDMMVDNVWHEAIRLAASE